MPFELIQQMGIRTQRDLCVIPPSSLEELENNINATLAKAVLDCRKLDDMKADNPAWALKRLNENGIGSIREASIDDIGSFTLRGFNIAHLIVLGEITSYDLSDMKVACPDPLRLLLETRSSNVLQLLPIELAAFVDRKSTRRSIIASQFYSDEFACSLFSQALQAHYALNAMHVVDVTRLLHLAILRGNTSIIKYIHSVYSQLDTDIGFRDLIIARNMHTLSVVNINSLTYILDSMADNGISSDSEIPLFYVYDSYGMLPIHFAVLNGYLACAIRLLQYDRGMINVLTKGSNVNVLDCAISSNMVECVAAIIGIIKEIGGHEALREQLQHRFGHLGCNALGLALLYNNTEIIALLLQSSTAVDVLTKMIPLQIEDKSQVHLSLMNAFVNGCTVLELLFFTEQYHTAYNFIIHRSIAEKKLLLKSVNEICSNYLGDRTSIDDFAIETSTSCPTHKPDHAKLEPVYFCSDSLAHTMIQTTCSTTGIIMHCVSRYAGAFVYYFSLLLLACNALYRIIAGMHGGPQLTVKLPLPSIFYQILGHKCKSCDPSIGTLVSIALSLLSFFITRLFTYKKQVPVRFIGVDLQGYASQVEGEKEKNTETAIVNGTDTPYYRICDIGVFRDSIRVLGPLETVHGHFEKTSEQAPTGAGDTDVPKGIVSKPTYLFKRSKKEGQICPKCLVPTPKKDTYCYFCSMCVRHRIFHSNILGFCISWSNIYSYLMGILFFYVAWVPFLAQPSVYSSKHCASVILLIFSCLVLSDMQE